MRILLLTIVLLSNLTILFGQDTDKVKYKRVKKVFSSGAYKRNEYPRFQKPIERVDKNTYKFGDKTLLLQIEDKRLEKLFDEGIFNPNVIFREATSRKPKPALGISTQNQTDIYNLTRNDSLFICCLQELEKLSPNPQTRRFKFWLFRIGMANPTEYYIEFYNQKATRRSSLEEFIENARLSFYYQGTIVI